MSMLGFRVEMIDGLLTPLKKPTQKFRDTEAQHLPTKAPLGANRRIHRSCCVASYTKCIRKDTIFQSELCSEVPAFCLGKCFQEHHK